MRRSGPIFKLPSSWKRSKQGGTAVVSAKTVVATDKDVQMKDNDGIWEDLDVEGRNTKYRLKRLKQELEEEKVREELEARRLKANFDKLDNQCFEAVFGGESGYVPKRRK